MAAEKRKMLIASGTSPQKADQEAEAIRLRALRERNADRAQKRR